MYRVELLNGRVVTIDGDALKQRRTLIRCLLLDELADEKAERETRAAPGRRRHWSRAAGARR